MKAGGRNPASIKKLAKLLEEAGQQEGSRGGPGAAELHLPDGQRPRTSSSATAAGSTRATRRARSASSRPWWRNKPIDPAQAHYNLARAYHLNHRDEKAKDELLAALEAAPGFRPAQKLLLELSGESGTQPLLKK